MATDGNYRVDTRAMADVLTSITGVLQQLDGAVRSTGALTVPTSGFGGIGSAVGAGSSTLQSQTGAALGALHAALTELDERLRRSLTGYQQADNDVAATLLALTPARWSGRSGR